MDITFIGGGNMAAALIGGLTAQPSPQGGTNGWRIRVIEPSASQRETLTARFPVACFESPTAQALQTDVVVFAVKPQQMREAARACAPFIANTLVISVAAGIRAGDLSRWLGGHSRLVRTMPNTPALIGRGITGMALFAGARPDDRDTADRILRAVGQTVWVDDESQLDAVTAVSGSGPAYVFRIIEAIEQAGTALGLPAAVARALTLGTFTGAAELAARSEEPAGILRERVTSKGGTTAAALAVMEEAAIGQTIGRALQAACARSREMGEAFGQD